jgi:hypothetical protein
MQEPYTFLCKTVRGESGEQLLHRHLLVLGSQAEQAHALSSETPKIFLSFNLISSFWGR